MQKAFLQKIFRVHFVLFLLISANAVASEKITSLDKEHIIVRYDFSKLNGDKVVDLSANAFEATLHNSAKVVTIGTEKTGIYNVLDLGAVRGLMNLGEGIGEVFEQLEEFTISVFFRVDNSYSFKEAGSPIMSLSNSLFASKSEDGYIELTLANLGYEISPTFRSDEKYTKVGINQPALQGSWHHLVYTQNNGIGIVYFDGNVLSSKEIDTTPKTVYDAQAKGTTINYIGHSTVGSESSLDKTMVYDFCIIDYPLSKEEIDETILASSNQVQILNKATNAYRASSKTHETKAFESINKGTPSKILIHRNSDGIIENQIVNINEINFDDTKTTFVWNNTENSIVENSTIEKITFEDYISSNQEILNASNEFVIYPNPATSTIQVQNIKNDILIYSVTGRLMKQVSPQKIINQTIDISQLKNGLYIIKSGNKTKRLIKK